MNKEFSGVILTAGKADVTICEVFGDLPTGLIPVNGKPIIFYILQQMYEQGIKQVYIGVDYKKNVLKDIVNLYFKNKLEINFVYTDSSKAPGNSLLNILKNEIKGGQVVINLADTYIKNLKFKDMINSVVVSKDFIDETKWTTVEIENNKIINFIDREISDKNLYVLCGLYVLNDISIFLEYETNNNKLIQIHELLSFYFKKREIKPFFTDTWLDFGHIDKYYVSKKKLIQSRGFNFLEYDDLLGTIMKKSRNKDKFIYEIKWQLNLPRSIQVLAPRVLEYSVDKNPFIKMEFYSYPTLSEIWLFSDLNDKVYFSIINKLLNIIDLFRGYKCIVPKQDYNEIYIKKTIKRVSEIKNKQINSLMQQDNIKINMKSYKNWKIIKDDIFLLIDKLYNNDDNCLIHGDFCLSNILYDLRSGLVRLIDPRGIWGSSENGDIKYDIAKLRHSICGDYDYIVNDLFNIQVTKGYISYSIFNSNKQIVKKYFDQVISKEYDIRQIKLIEGLLFLSMIPLHEDNANRQLVMYMKSIELFNNILLEEKTQ